MEKGIESLRTGLRRLCREPSEDVRNDLFCGISLDA